MRQLNWFGGVAILTLAAALASGQPAPTVTINTTSLPNGDVSTPYSQALSASSVVTGVAITWSISGGALPGGLNLSADGTISGTPTTAGLTGFVVQATQVTIDGTFTATQPLTISINAAQITITTPSLLFGTLGVAYSQTFTAAGGVTGDVQAWSLLSGNLPPGLSLTQGGTLSGTPTASGSYQFLIQVVNLSVTGATATAIKGITLVVAAPATITITTNPTLPPGSVGVAYAEQLAATGGVPQYSWSVDSGALPGGVSLTPTSGVISGTPTSAGTFSFQVSVTDQSGLKGTGAFTLVVTAPLSISTAPALPPGASGAPYSFTLTATGGTPPYTWSAPVQVGSLPPGLTLDPLSGRLTGTPTAVGTYPFLVVISDAAKRTVSKSLTLDITALLAIATASPLPNGSVGGPYQAQLNATGGTPAYTWSIASGALPVGLTLNAATGVLSGTPTANGNYQFSVVVSDAAGRTASKPLTINVTALLAIATASPLPDGTIGSSYQLQLSATGGIPAFTWSITTGTLPAGLTLNAATGVLSGTPTASGSYQFTVVVSDAAGRTASKPLTLNITASLTIVTSSPLTNGAIGSSYQLQLSATGGTRAYTWSISAGALPGGITLNPATGMLSGTPTANGSYQFLAVVSDAAGRTASKPLTLNVTALLTISTASPLPDGAVGGSYQLQLSATGGTPAYTWSITTGTLPAGITLNLATGMLSGTPTAGGSSQFLVGVTDAAGRTASKSLTLNITASLTIVTASPLPDGAIGVAYQAQLSATGGTPAYTWSITGGALPAGITLNPATGMLSGTPTARGIFNVTISVKDALQSVTKAYRMTISATALPAVTITGLPDTPSPATQPALGISLGAAYTQNLTGQAALTFKPDSASDDPAVQFTTGGRSADFQIPAGTTQAVFAGASLGVQTGTVAGTITVTLRILAAGVDVTPTPAPTKVLRIAAAPPVIISAKLTANSTGFDLVVIGYSTTREVTGTTVHLTPASGATLATSDFTIPLTTVFPVWYQDPNSVQFGSQFSLHIPFGVQNVANAVGSLTITLTNSQGTSTAANATF